MEATIKYLLNPVPRILRPKAVNRQGRFNRLANTSPWIPTRTNPRLLQVISNQHLFMEVWQIARYVPDCIPKLCDVRRHFIVMLAPINPRGRTLRHQSMYLKGCAIAIRKYGPWLTQNLPLELASPAPFGSTPKMKAWRNPVFSSMVYEALRLQRVENFYVLCASRDRDIDLEFEFEFEIELNKRTSCWPYVYGKRSRNNKCCTRHEHAF